MYVIPIKTSNGKKLLFYSKYPTEKQARYARFALIKLANCSHLAPADIEVNEKGSVLQQNPNWSIGEVTKM